MIGKTIRQLPFFTLLLTLQIGCSSDQAPVVEPDVIRGLKGFQVSDSASSEVRRYPSVVQPAKESKLSFEVSGKLTDIRLEVGQRVETGQVLAEIDPVSLKFREQQAKASLDEAKAAYRNARLDYDRKTPLLAENFVTQSEVDEAKNRLVSVTAQVEQASKQWSIAKDDLSKTQLISPFKAVISSIEVKDYEQVSPGQEILGLYSENGYELSFSVPATIINHIKLGDSAEVFFPDLSGQSHRGHIKELGGRAAQVSAFPIVVIIDEPPPGVRAGMAAEVSLQISVWDSSGYLIPLSCLYFGNTDEEELQTVYGEEPTKGFVYLYNPLSSTVSIQEVSLLGIRENMVIVREGLSHGDIVAGAGVSYLHDGQKVKLLPLDQQ